MRYIYTNTESNYTSMNNAFLQDKRLSLQAKGLLAEILTNKPDWKIYLNELEGRSTNGTDSHRRAYSELKKLGYIKHHKRSNGRGVQMHVFAQDNPISEDSFKILVSRIDG